VSRGLVLLGFGGHARSVADVALKAGYQSLWFVDENAQEQESFLEFPVRRFEPPTSEGWVYVPCAGDNLRRVDQLRRLVSRDLPVASIISPGATVGSGGIIAPGCFVGHHSHVGPMTRLGAGCIVNTGAIVEHDCVVGECAHISVGACVAGRTAIGDRVFLGAGAVVIDEISIAADVTVGAGSVVASSIEAAGVYVGIPARRVQKG